MGLPEGRDAFAARALLAQAAERTLDVQYYIWHDDMSGILLFDALRAAADRGVRVRLLLDDNNTTAHIDTLLAALNAHRNIAVRLFNPFTLRRRGLAYLTDFARLNRRMHNKAFTADNQVTIIGGRNVGDEYFDAGSGVAFVDLDVLAIGPVVNDVSRDFERYWTSASSHPAEQVLPAAQPESRSPVAVAAAHVMAGPAAVRYANALAQTSFVRQLLARELQFEWAVAHMVSDDPAKGLGRAAPEALLWPRLQQLLGQPSRELLLISPYFVPGAEGSQFLAALAERGVTIKVLTNSLEATDVSAVHSGYAKRRRVLLEAGVVLFELRRAASAAVVKGGSRSGSSGASLHAKTFAFDRARLFVGSFNFDPRSARLNTEMGFVIDSPALAQHVIDAFAGPVPARAYRVVLGNEALAWVEQRDGGDLVHDDEPGATFWRRVSVFLMSLLPIEWLL